MQIILMIALVSFGVGFASARTTSGPRRAEVAFFVGFKTATILGAIVLALLLPLGFLNNGFQNSSYWDLAFKFELMCAEVGLLAGLGALLTASNEAISGALGAGCGAFLGTILVLVHFAQHFMGRLGF